MAEEVTIIVKTKIDQASRNLKALGDRLEQTGSQMQNLGSKFTMAFTAPLTAGLYAIGKQGMESSRALADLKKNISDAIASGDTQKIREAQAALAHLDSTTRKAAGAWNSINQAVVPLGFAFQQAGADILQAGADIATALKPEFAGLARELGLAFKDVGQFLKDSTPAIREFVKGLTDILKWYNSLPDDLKKFLFKGFVSGAVAGPALLGVGNAVSGAANMFKLLGGGLGAFGAGAGAAGAGSGAGAAGAAGVAGGAGLGILGFAGSALAGIPAGLLAYDWLAKNFGLGGGTRLNQFATVGAYGLGSIFGQNTGLAAAGAVGRATGAMGGPTIVYNNYGVDANNPYLKNILTPYMNSNARDRGQR